MRIVNGHMAAEQIPAPPAAVSIETPQPVALDVALTPADLPPPVAGLRVRTLKASGWMLLGTYCPPGVYVADGEGWHREGAGL